MSVIDGGSFKCYSHEPIFETVDPNVWKEHKTTCEGMTESGSTACAVCGKQTSFVHKPVNKKAICDDCRKDLTS